MQIQLENYLIRKTVATRDEEQLQDTAEMKLDVFPAMCFKAEMLRKPKKWYPGDALHGGIDNACINIYGSLWLKKGSFADDDYTSRTCSIIEFSKFILYLTRKQIIRKSAVNFLLSVGESSDITAIIVWDILEYYTSTYLNYPGYL